MLILLFIVCKYTFWLCESNKMKRWRFQSHHWWISFKCYFEISHWEFFYRLEELCPVPSVSGMLRGNEKEEKRCTLMQMLFSYLCCSQCDKMFSSCTGLKKHMFMHTGEKPHSCVTCHKTFAQKSNLKIHLKVHKNI